MDPNIQHFLCLASLSIHYDPYISHNNRWLHRILSIKCNIGSKSLDCGLSGWQAPFLESSDFTNRNLQWDGKSIHFYPNLEHHSNYRWSDPYIVWSWSQHDHRGSLRCKCTFCSLRSLKQFVETSSIKI